MPDRVHLFISATPLDSPTWIVKVFRGFTALRLFKKFPDARATRGVASIDAIQKYIVSQFTELHPPIKTSDLRSER
jgi:REP element-mobilizing transposase RayT